MKNNKGFSLVELLATVTIIGILSGIAVYGITRSILNSRKQIYLAAVKAQVKGVQLIINSEKYNVFDEDTVYYFDYKILKKTDDIRSPFGEWDKAYVVVTYTEKNDNEKEKLNYYWIGIDEKGWKIDLSKKVENMTIKDIYHSKDHNIEPGYTIDDREKMVLVSLDENEKEVKTSGKVLNKMSLEQASTCFTYKLLSNNTYEITGYNFDECSMDVNLPSSIDNRKVTSIGDGAFRSTTSNITSVRLYDGIETIKVGAFQGNEITKVIIPSTVKKIQGYAFYNNKISELYLPDGLEYIGEYAFGNNYIKTLVLPSGLKTIQTYAFYGNLIEKIEFNSSPTISTAAFNSNNLSAENGILYKRDKNGKYDYRKIIGYCGEEKNLVIPKEVNGVAPVTIYGGAFASSGLKSVTIPASIQTIERDAFMFNELETVIFEGAEEPEGAGEYGVYYGGTKSSLKSIGIGSFRNNKLRKVVIPKTVTSLGSAVFNQNEIGDSNPKSGFIYGRKIGEDGLGETDYTILASYGYGKTVERAVEIPAFPVDIEGNPIEIPSGEEENYMLKEILENAFLASKINNLTLPNIGTGDGQVKLTIGKQAFNRNRMKNQKLVYRITDGVIDYTTTGSYAVVEKNIVLPESVTINGEKILLKNIDSSFAYYDVRTITIPKGVENICEQCLQKTNKNNTKLVKIVNKTGKAFDWSAITKSNYSQEPFETGV